jgi:hypothetical protein
VGGEGGGEKGQMKRDVGISHTKGRDVVQAWGIQLPVLLPATDK